MNVRKATISDLETILGIYAYAREFMASTGNPNQWKNNRPAKESVIKRIHDEVTYVIEFNDEIKGVFVLIKGIDPTYNHIEGKWLNDTEYVTVHALAKAKNAEGIFDVAINYAKATCANVRIDTHADNKIMQKLILKAGFKYTGIIYVDDGTPRLAYQFIRKEIDYNKKLFIVDYDGTVINSMEKWSHTCSDFIKSKGLELKEDIDSITVTQTNRETTNYMIEHYFPNLSFEEMDKMIVDFVKDEYPKNKLKSNALEMLKKFKKHGRVVLFSATAMNLLKSSLNALDINSYFDMVYSASDLAVTKRDGTGFLKVCELENISIDDSLVVEDALYRLKGAKGVGFTTLGVEDISTINHLHEIFKNSDYYLNIK